MLILMQIYRYVKLSDSRIYENWRTQYTKKRKRWEYTKLTYIRQCSLKYKVTLLHTSLRFQGSSNNDWSMASSTPASRGDSSWLALSSHISSRTWSHHHHNLGLPSGLLPFGLFFHTHFTILSSSHIKTFPAQLNFCFLFLQYLQQHTSDVVIPYKTDENTDSIIGESQTTENDIEYKIKKGRTATHTLHGKTYLYTYLYGTKHRPTLRAHVSIYDNNVNCSHLQKGRGKISQWKANLWKRNFST